MVNVLGGSAGSMANTTLGIEGIQEWRVITNTLSAEYGMTMGSQMTIVTKSGTNAFPRVAVRVPAQQRFRRAQLLRLPHSVTPDRLPPFKRNNYGGSLGGPLKRDNLFFFFTYEGLRERLGITSVANTIPAQCRQEPLPIDGPAASMATRRLRRSSSRCWRSFRCRTCPATASPSRSRSRPMTLYSKYNKYRSEILLGLGDYSYETSVKCWKDIVGEIDPQKMKISFGNHEFEGKSLLKQYMEYTNLDKQYYSFDSNNGTFYLYGYRSTI